MGKKPVKQRPYTELGRRIRRARQSADISQSAFARQLEITNVTIWRWESGTKRPGLDKLVQISDLLDVSLDVLVKGRAA